MTLSLGNSLSDPRIRPPCAKVAPVPSTQRDGKHQHTDDHHAAVNLEIEAFQAEVNARSNSMAEKFGFSVRHCKDLLLSAGVHTIFARPNGSAYNAFLSMKAKELRESEFTFYFCYYSVQQSSPR
jgi:hypothetical protein